MSAPPPRILVVEDEALNRALIRRMLRTLGVDADFSNDGAEAVAAAKAAAYDLIFMDLRMPRVDGFAATRAIREWERQQGAVRKPARIVALTSIVSAESRLLCAEAGMDGFLGKPVDLETLRSLVAPG